MGPITATKAILCPVDPVNERLCSVAHAQHIPQPPFPVWQASAVSIKVSGFNSDPPVLMKQTSGSLEGLLCMAIAFLLTQLFPQSSFSPCRRFGVCPPGSFLPDRLLRVGRTSLKSSLPPMFVILITVLMVK